MTAQAEERIIYRGEETWMQADPLSPYLRKMNIRFLPPSTACWRGYYGRWEISESRLYLIGLEAYVEGPEKVGLNYLFPGQERVFAQWFTGTVRIPRGELLEYVHMGYSSVYEKYLILSFSEGVLTGEMEIDHSELQDGLSKPPA